MDEQISNLLSSLEAQGLKPKENVEVIVHIHNVTVQSAKDAEEAYETDERRIQARTRQIEIGKNTRGYQNFLRKCPKRSMRSKEDPVTPQKSQKCSTRSWAGQMKKWRRQLHAFDSDSDDNDENLVPLDL